MKEQSWIINKIVECAVLYSKGRRVIAWGMSEYMEELTGAFNDKGMDIFYCIESDESKVRGKVRSTWDFFGNVYDKGNYYIVVPLDYHAEIYETFRKYGLTKEVDYVYPAHLPIRIIASRNYTDEYGNEMILPETETYENLTVKFKGCGSRLVIGRNLKVPGAVVIECDNDCRVSISDNVKLGENAQWYSWKNSTISVGADCRFGENGVMEAGRNASVAIGRNTNIGSRYYMISHINTRVSIGCDCDISSDFQVRTNDGHSIFDISSGKNINVSLERNKWLKLIVSNHVWIGTRCVLLGSVLIGSGSVIGACSLVKGNIPNNCVAAGTPATVRKRDIAWSRENCAEKIDIIPEEYINYTEE